MVQICKIWEPDGAAVRWLEGRKWDAELPTTGRRWDARRPSPTAEQRPALRARLAPGSARPYLLERQARFQFRRSFGRDSRAMRLPSFWREAKLAVCPACGPAFTCPRCSQRRRICALPPRYRHATRGDQGTAQMRRSGRRHATVRAATGRPEESAQRARRVPGEWRTQRLTVRSGRTLSTAPRLFASLGDCASKHNREPPIKRGSCVGWQVVSLTHPR
jgi:hypothetical protein